MRTDPPAVYRLEDAQGRGPFSGEQVCVPHLQPHFDPEDLVAWMGLPQDALKALTTAHFVFGWRSQRHYRAFFQPRGQAACRDLGFTLVTYYPTLRWDLPDGQVLFAREPAPPALPVVQALLQALSNAPTRLSWADGAQRTQVREAAVRQQRRTVAYKPGMPGRAH